MNKFEVLFYMHFKYPAMKIDEKQLILITIPGIVFPAPLAEESLYWK